MLPKQAPVELIHLTPQGRVRLPSRERASPADRGIVPLHVFLGVPGKQLALLAPAVVTEEEKAFLTEVAVSDEKEWQEAEEETKAELQNIYVETVQRFYRNCLRLPTFGHQDKARHPVPRVRLQYQPLSH